MIPYSLVATPLNSFKLPSSPLPTFKFESPKLWLPLNPRKPELHFPGTGVCGRRGMVSIPPRLLNVDLDYLYNTLPQTQRAVTFRSPAASITHHFYRSSLFFAKSLPLSTTYPQLRLWASGPPCFDSGMVLQVKYCIFDFKQNLLFVLWYPVLRDTSWYFHLLPNWILPKVKEDYRRQPWIVY